MKSIKYLIHLFFCWLYLIFVGVPLVLFLWVDKAIQGTPPSKEVCDMEPCPLWKTIGKSSARSLGLTPDKPLGSKLFTLGRTIRHYWRRAQGYTH